MWAGIPEAPAAWLRRHRQTRSGWPTAYYPTDVMLAGIPDQHLKQ